MTHDENCASWARDLCDCRGVPVIVRLTLRPSRRLPRMFFYATSRRGAPTLLRRLSAALEAVRRDLPIAVVLDERRRAA